MHSPIITAASASRTWVDTSLSLSLSLTFSLSHTHIHAHTHLSSSPQWTRSTLRWRTSLQISPSPWRSACLWVGTLPLLLSSPSSLIFSFNNFFSLPPPLPLPLSLPLPFIFSISLYLSLFLSLCLSPLQTAGRKAFYNPDEDPFAYAFSHHADVSLSRALSHSKTLSQKHTYLCRSTHSHSRTSTRCSLSDTRCRYHMWQLPAGGYLLHRNTLGGTG